MRNLWKQDKDGVWDVLCGSHINNTITDAIALAQDDVEVAFKFNGVLVRVRANSDPNLIYRDWYRALLKYIEAPVGPYPAAELTAAELASDARIAAEAEQRHRERLARQNESDKAKAQRVEERLALADPMRFSDESKWKATVAANTDGYGAGVIRYAECWARLMQLEVSNGHTVSDVAEATSCEADIEGITGTMHGFAMSILIACWELGDELRRWRGFNR